MSRAECCLWPATDFLAPDILDKCGHAVPHLISVAHSTLAPTRRTYLTRRPSRVASHRVALRCCEQIGNRFRFELDTGAAGSSALASHARKYRKFRIVEDGRSLAAGLAWASMRLIWWIAAMGDGAPDLLDLAALLIVRPTSSADTKPTSSASPTRSRRAHGCRCACRHRGLDKRHAFDTHRERGIRASRP